MQIATIVILFRLWPSPSPSYLVAEGLGIAFVPTSMRRAPVRGAVFRPVSTPPTIDQMLFWSPRNHSPCLPGFLDVCAAAVAAAAPKARVHAKPAPGREARS